MFPFTSPLISLILIGFLVIYIKFAEVLSELVGKYYQFAGWIPGQWNLMMVVPELGTHLLTSALSGFTFTFKIDVSAGGNYGVPSC